MYGLYLLLSGCRYGHWLSHFPLCLIKIHTQTPHRPGPAARNGEEITGTSLPTASKPSLGLHTAKATGDAYDADNII